MNNKIAQKKKKINHASEPADLLWDFRPQQSLEFTQDSGQKLQIVRKRWSCP